MKTSIAADLRELAENDVLLEIGRRAVEDALVDLRESRVSVIRNNGLAIKEYDSTPSSVIRMGPETAVRIALNAIAAKLEHHS